MSAAVRTGGLVVANLRLFARDPGPLLGRIVQPVLSLFVLQGLYVSALGDHDRGTTQVVTGYLVLFSLLATSVVGNSLLTERRWRTFDRLRASPAATVELLAGKAVPVLLFLVVQQVVLLTVGIVALGMPVHSAPLLAIVDLCWALCVVCTGCLVATSVNSAAQMSAVIDIGAMLATAVGGGLVPLSVLPAWAVHVAPVSPAYWAVRGLTAGAIDHPGAALSSAGVLLAFAAGAALVSGRRLARGWGRESLI